MQKINGVFYIIARNDFKRELYETPNEDDASKKQDAKKEIEFL